MTERKRYYENEINVSLRKMNSTQIITFNVDSFNKQTLLFKDTVFDLLCVSLGCRTLLVLLAAGCIGRFCVSWPMLGPSGGFDVCKVVPCVSWLKFL